MPRFGLVGKVFPFRGQDCIFPEISFTKSRQKKKSTNLCVEPHTQDFSFSAYTNRHSTYL